MVVLDPDYHWCKVEGLLLSVTDKIDKGHILPCAVFDTLHEFLLPAPADDDDHERSMNRRLYMVQAHGDYDAMRARETEVAVTKACFADMDNDGSGSITIDELRACMREKDPLVSEQDVRI